MPTYLDLLKYLEQEAPKRLVLVLPHPIEEIFPEEKEEPIVPSQQDILKKNYENLIADAFEEKRV